MVAVTVCDEGEKKSLVMTGHANYSPENDIVCAACSAVVFALIGFMQKAPEHLYAVEALRCVKGDVEVTALGDAAFAGAFAMAVTGLAQISKKYPQHLWLKET